MNRSTDAHDRLLPEHSAVQHDARQHAPRPLPLFLELLREVSERDPELARDALAGLCAYERAPRHFSNSPESSRSALHHVWHHSQHAATALHALPMEVLQAAFWSLDPERTVRKFADFGRLDPESPTAQRFVALEDWANEGEPL